MMEPIQVFTSVEKQEDAEKIASTLIENRLAACVQIIPRIESLFWWQGKIEKAKESLVIIKTRKGLFDEVVSSIKSVHPYEVPEIISMPILQGNERYIEWLLKETKG